MYYPDISLLFLHLHWNILAFWNALNSEYSTFVIDPLKRNKLTSIMLVTIKRHPFLLLQMKKTVIQKDISSELSIKKKLIF